MAPPPPPEKQTKGTRAAQKLLFDPCAARAPANPRAREPVVKEFFANLNYGDISDDDAKIILETADADKDGRIGGPPPDTAAGPPAAWHRAPGIARSRPLEPRCASFPLRGILDLTFLFNSV